MTDHIPLPPALPAPVYLQIWCEVLGEVAGTEMHDIIERGIGRPAPQMIEDFAQGAMEYPHFAKASEIRAALRLSASGAQRAVDAVKRRARENRHERRTYNERHARAAP